MSPTSVEPEEDKLVWQSLLFPALSHQPIFRPSIALSPSALIVAPELLVIVTFSA